MREKIWLSVFSEAATNLDGLIFTFAFDRTVRGGFIDEVRKVVEEGGGEVLFVELKCSIEELERRITDSSRQKFGKLNSVKQFRELNEAGAFVDPGISEDRLVIDTTALSAHDAAVLIMRAWS